MDRLLFKVFLGWLCITLCALSVHAKRHPLHVSTTDVSFNAVTKKLEVICTIFTDDFEAAIYKQYHSKADFANKITHSNMDALVKNYINKHLQITTSQMISLNYIGFEVNRELVNVYLESAATVTPPKKIEASVSLLHNLFDDQLNIVHITVNGTRKSTKLDYPQNKVTQVF